ncbi:hypothetical protein E4U13_003294 [Claviceps humidiphila]|uniref:Hsp70 protein n=1 Tax=Claviceps humidiphila TaxID=1294629 RepID=A0A9P7PXS0_9HYPO|nr:hypothetical protein E4U13_003294 [Claviceps humidiphila]
MASNPQRQNDRLFASNDRLFASSQREEKLIIAMDFGTTYSGVAYCFANQIDAKPVAIMNWPGNRGIAAPKIPTILEYSEEETTGFRWGASVNKSSAGIVAIKLLLDPKQERPLYLPATHTRTELKTLPKAPIEIAADFMRAIYEHALEEIASAVPKAYMDICQKEFVLSVPAVWSDAAKNSTLKVNAAELAGIESITVVKEPEAAAMYSIKSLEFSIKKNDAFVASVGLPMTLSTRFPFITSNQGGMAGSLGLNDRFAAAVEELVGDDQWLKLKMSKAWSIAEKQFDQEVKKSFRGELDVEYYVNFPMANLREDEDGGLVSNTWRLTGLVLSRIFEPLIADIVEMIDYQVQAVRRKRPEKGISGILLVGGFGSSHYLMKRVKQHFPGIQILQPQDAWAAIVKGSVLSKLPSQVAVTSTCATRHYGTRGNVVYRESTHAGERACLDRSGDLTVTVVSFLRSDIIGVYAKKLSLLKSRVKMEWFIKTGDNILRDQRFEIQMEFAFDDIHDAGTLIYTHPLWQCEDNVAPPYPSKGNKLAVNCHVTADLRGVPKDKFIPRIDKEETIYHVLNINLVMAFKSAVMTFSMEVDGEEMGSTEVDYV